MGKFLDSVVPAESYAGIIGVFFLYGPPGVGKTKFAAGAPDPVWIDLERSTDTLANSPDPAERAIPVLRTGEHIHNMTDLVQATKELAESKYETIVIDSVTRLQAYQMNEYLLIQEGAGAKVLNYTRELAAAKFNHYKAQIQDWGFSTNLLDEMFMYLDRSGKNVILIGHERVEKDEGTGIMQITFDLTPALRGRIASLVSVAGYMYMKNKPGAGMQRFLQVNPDPRKVAKNRLNLNIDLPDPTWTKLIEAVENNRN